MRAYLVLALMAACGKDADSSKAPPSTTATTPTATPTPQQKIAESPRAGARRFAGKGFSVELPDGWEIVKIDRPNILFGPATKDGRAFTVLDAPAKADTQNDDACKAALAPMVEGMQGTDGVYKALETPAGKSCEATATRAGRTMVLTVLPLASGRQAIASCDDVVSHKDALIADCKTIIASWKSDATTAPSAESVAVPAEKRITKNGVSMTLLDGWHVVDSTKTLISLETLDGTRGVVVTRTAATFDVATEEKCATAGKGISAKVGLGESTAKLQPMAGGPSCVVFGMKDGKKLVFVMYDATQLMVTCAGTMGPDDISTCATIAGSLQVEKN